MPDSDEGGLRARYIRFADGEARGRSPLYEQLARGVAGDPAVRGFLLGLPPEKRQPNLLFAAVRLLRGTPDDYADFRRRLLADAEAVASTMRARSTQTNEPGRCATLLPVLARLPQPLALIEVGASAGLCLLPDAYGYDFGSRRLRPEGDDGRAPVFACAADPGTPVPAAMPRVAWRAGLDLDPVDAADPDHASWLEALVWPEQAGRLAGLRGALRVAASRRPRVVRGSLTGEALPALCREAPGEATLVIFHTAVLAYVGEAERRAFAARAASLCRFWVCNEAPRTTPDLASLAPAPAPAGRFLLSVNGRPTAWTDPHGAEIAWIADR